MNRLILLLALAPLAYGQTKVGPRIPAQDVYANRPTSPATGTVFIMTDTDCSGTTSATPTQCRWSGSVWQATGGTGGSGGCTTNSLSNNGSATNTCINIPCTLGTITLASGTWTYPGGTVAAAANVSQEIPIVSSVTGTIRYTSVRIAESTIFTSTGGTPVTVLKASMGPPGSSTNDQLLPQFSLMQSSGSANFATDRPSPPQITSTYDLVVAFRVIVPNGAFINTLTAGAVTYEACGYAVQ